ncbi:PASTA domain-containing protein [Streptomyces venezuelae]|uniref:PASTA domain-containing protein n=1 Tax=Streptomyces venezuelae TaxID=54571 RepID=UPI00343A3947
MRARLARAGTVVGGTVAAGLMAVTAAVAAGPPMPDFRGRTLTDVHSTVGWRTRVDAADLSGFRRHVLWPANWKVCTQSPAPGQRLDGETITLGVVKTGERCPRT